MASMFERTNLTALLNTELIAFANSAPVLNSDSVKDLKQLVSELSLRLETLAYMMEATLDGQDRSLDD